MSTPADQTMAVRLRLLLLLATAGVRERSLVESEAANRKWHPSVLSDAIAEGLIDDDQAYLYLSPAGEEALGELCRNASRVSDIDDPVLVLEEFEVLDMEFKSAATKWQDKRTRDDPEESVAVVERVVGIDSRVRELLGKHMVVVPMLNDLEVSLNSFIEGDDRKLTSAADDSYHSLWFVLHELLLRMAGRSRDSR